MDPGNKLAEWTYDTAPLGAGLPATSSRIIQPGGHRYTTTVTGYDGRGRPTGSQLTLPDDTATLGLLAGTSYATSTGYDQASKVITSTYPAAGGLAAETLTFGYTSITGDRLSLPRTVTGSVDNTAYIAATRYDVAGLLIGRDLGAGSARTVRNYSYDSLNRLSTINTSVPSATTPTVQDDAYSYDGAHNVTGIARNSTGQRECFQYTDGLNRLTRAYTRAVKDELGNPTPCATSPNPDATAPAPYDKSYAYTPTGNRSVVTDHRLPAPNTGTYTYDTTTPGGPHAVKTITGVNASSFSYDANGAMTSRSTGGVTSTLGWDRLHKLSSVTAGTAVTRFIYGAGGTVTATRFYPGGAMRKAGEPVKWILTDHQASTVAVVTANGTATASVTRPQDPYGARRTSDPLPTERGFLGKPEDPTGLVATDNRYYDPAIGVFISPDPLLVPTDPQTLNGYRYGANNPVTLMDPSGLREAQCEGPCPTSSTSRPYRNHGLTVNDRMSNWRSLQREIKHYHIEVANFYGEVWRKEMAAREASVSVNADVVLDMFGMLPVVGAPVDVVHAGYYLARGRKGLFDLDGESRRSDC